MHAQYINELRIAWAPGRFQNVFVNDLEHKKSNMVKKQVNVKPNISKFSLYGARMFIWARMTFDEHVRNVCKASYYHIRGLWHIRAALSKDTACVVASAIVGSRLDYCNALLVGISEANLDKLQCVQNPLARIVTGTCRRDHISPVLTDLHWLPIRARITYKIAMLVFKMREVKQPMYLAELIEDYKPACELRSTSRLLLKEPCVKSTTGQRSFHFAAAKIWNGLPDHIRSLDSLDTFKKHTKTNLHTLSYCT